MHLQESGEMYLETILVLSRRLNKVRSVDVAEEMGYSKPSVSRAVGILKKNGYIIKSLNTINFRKSMHYNPFAYIRSEKDILKLVNTIIVNTKGDGDKSGEDFWVSATRSLTVKSQRTNNKIPLFG